MFRHKTHILVGLMLMLQVLGCTPETGQEITEPPPAT
jgi:hypothetical protein